MTVRGEEQRLLMPVLLSLGLPLPFVGKTAVSAPPVDRPALIQQA